MKRLYITFLVALVLVIGFASAAAPIYIYPDNTSAHQLGGAYSAYTFASGDDTFEVFTVVPLTVQGIVYPLEFWYAAWYLSWLCLILAILMTVFNDRVPAIAITAFGVLAFGGFLICAFMLPYTASMTIDVQILQNVDKLGVPIGNNSIYITQVADYRASPVHAWICYGLAIAGFIEMILGVLSFFGWFHRKGLKDAKNGKYLETDHEDDDPRGDGGYRNW